METYSCAIGDQLWDRGNSALACSEDGLPSSNAYTDVGHQNDEHILLIVDDDDIFLRSIKTFLKSHVANIFTAVNPHEATEILKQHPVNVLVCDYDLGEGEINGVQLIRTLRKKHPDIKRAVIFSAKDPSEILRSKSVDVILQKATNLDRLRSLVRRRFL